MSSQSICYLRELAVLLKEGKDDEKTNVWIKFIKPIKYTVEQYTEYKIRPFCEKYAHQNEGVRALAKKILALERAQLKEILEKINEKKDEIADKKTIKTLISYINRKDGWLHTAIDYIYRLKLTDKQIDDFMLEDLLLRACRCDKCKRRPRLGEKEFKPSEEDIKVVNEWLKLFNQPKVHTGKMVPEKKSSLRFDPIGRSRR